MAGQKLKMSCYASVCECLHDALDEKICNKIVWVVDAKTFFDIAICIAKSRSQVCKCEVEKKCDCKSINSGIYAACCFTIKT